MWLKKRYHTEQIIAEKADKEDNAVTSIGTQGVVRMKKEYRLCEVEDAIAKMNTSEVADDIAETDDNMQLVISGWYVHIPELSLNLREGIAGIWDGEEHLFMPDFAVTVVYEGDVENKEWLYCEQDGFVTALEKWLKGRLPVEEIEQMRCEIVIP